MARIRLLDRLCELHPESDREELLALVLCGDVAVDEERVRDPRALIARDARISTAIAEDGSREYVGRGALKLEHAIRSWNLPVRGKVFVDAGASTGGFTDCLLAHGARHVHAVDVGYNQLDYRLRSDARVDSHERVNIMHVTSLEPPANAGVADLSFRSIRGAARHLLELTSEGWAVVLVKPQFEWDAPPASFDGTVPEAEVARIVRVTLEGLVDERAFPAALLESPIRGRKGNREFLVLIRAEESSATVDRLVGELTS